MTRLIILILTLECFCNTLSFISPDTENVTSYKILSDQLQHLGEDFVKGNFRAPGINNACAKQLGAFANGLNPMGGDMQLWAAKMFDATGKLEPSILEGNMYSLGSYDECLSIRGESVLYDKETLIINGKYCVGTFMFISLGTCMPNACSAEELNLLTKAINLPLSFDELYCQVHEDAAQFSWGDIVTIVFLAIAGLVAIVSTGCDLYLRRTNEKKTSSIYLSFSLLSNGEKLFGTARSSDQLECLSGIRALSMMWIILSHMFTNVFVRPVSNLSYMHQFYSDGWTMYVRGASVSVDSFFLMSGIVLIYVYMKTIKTQTFRFNLFSYYLHRYIRLTPALAVMILIHVTLLRHFGSGPLWPLIDSTVIDQCKENWWVNLLYLQNFVNYEKMCMGQTWYLAVDTQLFLLSPLILIPLRRWKKQTLAMVAITACASIASAFAFAWTMELRDINSQIGTKTTEMTQDYMYYFYIAPYNRAGPYLIGILVGYFIYQVKIENRKFKLTPVHNIVMWIGALVVLSTCVFYDNAQSDYDRTAASFHMAFVRPAWAMALSWVVFACVTGYGGVINWFLSLPVFQILGRLTYPLYLVHFTTIFAVYSAQKTTVVLSNVALMYEFWSMYAVCIGVAIILTLLFESPIIVIEKSLKSKSK